MNQKHLKGIRR